MRRAWLVGLASCAAAAPALGGTAPAPAEAVASLAAFDAPAGWTRAEYANAGGVDAVVAFESGEDRLALKVFGAPGSFYKTAAEFLSGPAATTMGRKPERAGRVAVAGKRLRLWRRGVPLPDGDPHSAYLTRRRMSREVFVILPSAKDGRFLVLSYERRTEVPDPAARGEKAWRSLLKSIRPLAAAK